MTRVTTNLGTPYPETTDLADIPRQLRDMATSWENAFGGWVSFTPVVTQGSLSGHAPITIDPATSIARVRRNGKTVYVWGRLDVQAGNTLTGFPWILLPYPLKTPYVPAGVVINKVGSAFSWDLAITPATLEPGIVATSASSAARVAGDWFGLLLRYETV